MQLSTIPQPGVGVARLRGHGVDVNGLGII